jgi:E3 ubiquitin-protein ligase HUWE1
LGLVRLLSDIYCTHTLSHSKTITAIIQTFTVDQGKTLLGHLGRFQRACLIEKRFIKQNIPEAWYEKPKKEKVLDAGLRIIGQSSSQAVSSFDMDILTSAGATTTTTEEGPSSVSKEMPVDTINPKDSKIKNSQMIWHLVNEIPSVLAVLCKGIVKTLWARRISELSTRKSAHMVTEEVAKVLHDHLDYQRACK